MKLNSIDKTFCYNTFCFGESDNDVKVSNKYKTKAYGKRCIEHSI